MYCSECGHKNKKDAEFCSECGKKFNKKEEPSKKKTKTKQKNGKTKLSKKSKIGIVLGIILLVIGIFAYNYFGEKTSPKGFAEDYMKALIGNNSNKLYNLYHMEQTNEFTSKEMFKKYLSQSIGSFDKKTKYVIEGVKYSNGGLNATVTIKYNSSTRKKENILGNIPGTISLELNKTNEKQYLLFDKWEIKRDLFDDDLVETGFTLTVPKNAEVEIGGIKLTDKYKDKSSKKDTSDVYKIDEILNMKYKTTVTYPIGYKVTKNISPNDKYERFNITEEDLTEEELSALESTATKEIKNLYDNAIKGTPWSSISKNYKDEDDYIKDKYEDVQEEALRAAEEYTSKLTSFNITSSELTDFTYDSYDGEFDLMLKMNYSYTKQYSDETDDETGSTNVHISYDASSKELKVTSITGLPWI